MAQENVLAPAPKRSDEQILPFKAWMQSLRYTAFNWTSSGLLLMLIFFVRLWRLPMYTQLTHLCHLQMVKRRHESPVYVTGFDFPLGNLKFVPKVKECGKKKTNFESQKPKKPTSAKPSKPTPTKQPKPVKEKTFEPSPLKKIHTDSEVDIEILVIVEEQGEEVSKMMGLEETTIELDEGHAGSDLVYPRVHESLKLPTEEHVHIENPLSSYGNLSSMKNLDDAFTFGDQFFNDKSTEEELGKGNVDAKVESMVTVSIHQATSSIPPLSTPVIDISSPKPSSLPVQEVFITATTETTTTTTVALLPPPPP
nr:hypothetical protein [Tanacetum cinerariifolium]